MRELEINPYVIQIDKFVESLGKLSRMILHLEEKKPFFSEEGCRGMCDEVCEKVCKNCGRREVCIEKEKGNTYLMMQEVLYAIENYGAELNIEIKRKIQKKCIRAPQFLRTILEVSRKEKKNLLWEQKMMQNRESCALQLDRFAKMLSHSAHEMNASIFEDEHLEKKLRLQMNKQGMKLLSCVFFVTESGRYEIHVTVKAGKGVCVATKEVARIVSECSGRTMVTEKGERAIVGNEYCTLTFMEGPKFHTLRGIARIGKGCDRISGDSFSMLDLPGGKQGIILSDGMGSGETAFQESSRVVEVLEELLTAGFPKETALQMLNTALVIGREELRFSTMDVCVFDLYTGKCEIAKAGAAATYIKRKENTESIRSTSLPLGVLTHLEMEQEERMLASGDMVIMMTDGILDALPAEEQELLLQMIIEGTNINNPKELAHHVLEQVLECSGEVPLDDMTVLVIGIWSLEK